MSTSRLTPKHWGSTISHYGFISAVILAITLGLFQLRLTAGTLNASIVYLFVVLVCAISAPPGITLFCGLFSFLCYDFFLVPPVFTLGVTSPSQLIDPFAFLCVSLVTCVMAGRSRQRAMQTMVYQEANEFRATLLNLVSHNLRTPLATIKTALTSVLAGDPLPGESRQLLVDADQECDRLNRLIGNVLQLSQMDAHTIQPHTDWQSPDEVVSASLGRWRDALESGKLKAKLPESFPMVQFDFALIEAVLTNLIENAFRHGTPPVLLAIAVQPREIQFSVEDAGVGVPVMRRDKLFTRFSSTTASGIGLGLAVCKELIDLHGGRIWAEFEPGRTRFVFALPFVDEPGGTE